MSRGGTPVKTDTKIKVGLCKILRPTSAAQQACSSLGDYLV